MSHAGKVCRLQSSVGKTLQLGILWTLVLQSPSALRRFCFKSLWKQAFHVKILNQISQGETPLYAKKKKKHYVLQIAATSLCMVCTIAKAWGPRQGHRWIWRGQGVKISWELSLVKEVEAVEARWGAAVDLEAGVAVRGGLGGAAREGDLAHGQHTFLRSTPIQWVKNSLLKITQWAADLIW